MVYHGNVALIKVFFLLKEQFVVFFRAFCQGGFYWSVDHLVVRVSISYINRLQILSVSRWIKECGCSIVGGQFLMNYVDNIQLRTMTHIL